MHISQGEPEKHLQLRMINSAGKQVGPTAHLYEYGYLHYSKSNYNESCNLQKIVETKFNIKNYKAFFIFIVWI